jgi:hypothetical protein
MSFLLQIYSSQDQKLSWKKKNHSDHAIPLLQVFKWLSKVKCNVWHASEVPTLSRLSVSPALLPHSLFWDLHRLCGLLELCGPCCSHRVLACSVLPIWNSPSSTSSPTPHSYQIFSKLGGLSSTDPSSRKPALAGKVFPLPYMPLLLYDQP